MQQQPRVNAFEVAHNEYSHQAELGNYSAPGHQYGYHPEPVMNPEEFPSFPLVADSGAFGAHQTDSYCIPPQLGDNVDLT